MHPDRPFDDRVLFDVPCDSDLLRERLQDDRLVWVEERDGREVVAAALRSEQDDLAALLRTVESWVAERGVLRVSFELDGRTYTLRAHPVVESTAG